MLHFQPLFLALLCLLTFHPINASSDCPLGFGLSAANFSLMGSLCSHKNDIAKCCRYINAAVAVSVSRYSNATSYLGVPPRLSDTCIQSLLQTMQLKGVSLASIAYCGFGTKIPVTYYCQGMTTVAEMLRSPRFGDVARDCHVPLSGDADCKKCLNSGIIYLHHIVGADGNLTLSTCRDATYAVLASQVDESSAVQIASCFFQVPGLVVPPGTGILPQEPSESSVSNATIQGDPKRERRSSYHLALIPIIGISVTALTAVVLVFLVILIRRKSRELEETCGDEDGFSNSTWPIHRFQEGGTSMFRKFTYKETKKATNNFSTVLGEGGFGTVYKGVFGGNLVLAVKKMNKVSKQAEDEFCKEIELLSRLHHRNLVSLRGFCIERHERFLMYEFMANGSLSDHLERATLSWKTRMQVAIGIANALEYLHFYCNPPLCHRDIKSSNILLDESFIARVADFGLAHASKDGSIVFEAVNTDVRGTPGYMDPEYVVTQELTEMSDVYSYGVVVLELVTGRKAIQENRNLVEWANAFMESDPKLAGLVDPKLNGSFDFDQLQTMMTIVKWCTNKEGKERPSVKQILRLLYEASDPMNSGVIRVEDERAGMIPKGKIVKNEMVYELPSSSSTTRSYCSRSFLLETSPQSPQTNILLL